MDDNNGVKRELREHDRLINRHDQSISMLNVAFVVQCAMILGVVIFLLVWLFKHT